jgi:uncharacterized protein YdeI (BOF family)
MKKRMLFMIVPLVLLIIAAACSQPLVSNGNNLNEPVATPSPTVQTGQTGGTIGAILEASADYKDKEVVLKGKIVQECGSGCWFIIQDSTGQIYVDLAPSNLVIPQKVGSTAKVSGVVTISKGTTYLIGKKVEF